MKFKGIVLCFIITITFGMTLASCKDDDHEPAVPVLYEGMFNRLYDSLGISYTMTPTMHEVTKPTNLAGDLQQDYEFEFWYTSTKLTNDFNYISNYYVNKTFDVTSGGIFEGEDLFFYKNSTTCYFWMADKSDEPFSSSLNKDQRWRLTVERSEQPKGEHLRIVFTRVD